MAHKFHFSHTLSHFATGLGSVALRSLGRRAPPRRPLRHRRPHCRALLRPCLVARQDANPAHFTLRCSREIPPSELPLGLPHVIPFQHKALLVKAPAPLGLLLSQPIPFSVPASALGIGSTSRDHPLLDHFEVFVQAALSYQAFPICSLSLRRANPRSNQKILGRDDWDATK